jgi:AcrR family transcriptional regulator
VSRPRCPERHARILDATNALLETTGSVSELEIEAIAARARVGKQTIYKWWGNKRALVMEAALATVQGYVFAADTGDLRRDLVAFLKRSARLLRETSTGRTLSLLMAEAQVDVEFARVFRERFLEVRRQTLLDVLERAIERGQLREDTDLETFVDVVFGAFWYRLLTRRAPLNDRFAQAVVDLVLPTVRAA